MAPQQQQQRALEALAESASWSALECPEHYYSTGVLQHSSGLRARHPQKKVHEYVDITHYSSVLR